MNVLIVYASQFGTTEALAHSMASALEPRHAVRVFRARDVQELRADGVDLLMVGAPTQMHGLRLLVRPFLGGLRSRGFAEIPAAAFDTRLEGPAESTGAASKIIGQRLQAAGCRLMVPPEGFRVATLTGPLAEGEEDRARGWALAVAEQLAVAAPS